MPWYFYLALKQLFPTGRKFPFFTFMSGLGIAVGVALLVVSTSIMGGFGYEIRRMIVDTQGEIQVVAQGAISRPDEVIARVEKVPGVVAATPSAQGVVMLEYRNKPSFPAIQGVDLATVSKVIQLEKYVRLGSLDDLDDDSVILSASLARSLGASLGSQVELYSPLLIEKLKNDEVFLPRTVKVVGIFEIGHQQLDQSVVISTLRLMQDLYGLGADVHHINVRIKDGANEFEVADAINRVLPGRDQRAITWFEANADFQSVLRFEKYMVFFLLSFIVVVAALSIMSSLLISVVRKTREIGLLRALGGSGRQIAACYCVQGFLLGIVGTLGGLIISWLVIYYRDQIVRVVAGLTVGQRVFLEFYQFAHLPSHTTSFDIVVITVGSIIISTLAGLLPAWRAARLEPVEALRSE
ncbi:ABC transporter permease [Opitutaceae bacterium EW11]|nr:ABC transporter permease [Opitutaceae bacterium EW11]